MEEILEFIENYYLIFIILGCFCLLAIVGYVVEYSYGKDFKVRKRKKVSGEVLDVSIKLEEEKEALQKAKDKEAMERENNKPQTIGEFVKEVKDAEDNKKVLTVEEEIALMSQDSKKKKHNKKEK